MAQTIYQQALNEAKRKMQGASPVIPERDKLQTNVTPGQSTAQLQAAQQKAARGAMPAADAMEQLAKQQRANSAGTFGAAGYDTDKGRSDTVYNQMLRAAQAAQQKAAAHNARTQPAGALSSNRKSADTVGNSLAGQDRTQKEAARNARMQAYSQGRPEGYASEPAPEQTQGGRTADGKYRLGDGSAYDTLQGAINANAGSNDWEITEADGETLYDGKPLHSGTGVLAAKGNGGKITSSPTSGTYVYDAAGNLIRPSYYGKDVETGGHTLHGMFKSSNGYIYDYDTATDEELMNHGFYRAPDGTVRIAEDQDYILYQLTHGLDPSQAAANMVKNQLRSGRLNVPGRGIVDVSGDYPRGGTRPGGGSDPGIDPYVPGGQPTPQPALRPPRPDRPPEQAGQEQPDYGTAPEWKSSDYEQRRDEALKRAQSMRWDGSGYRDRRDALLAGAMDPYEGSPYDEKRDAAIEAAAENWRGSEYQPRRDEALERAENMRWNYDPNADPVWQALQKQYRREGDRATREAMGRAAAMTGGVPGSYAVTAASQAGDYYAAQLSDRLPQVYEDAYQRYLNEYQKQLGISDRYAGFDDREYARWADRQGRNLDLADRYNQYGQQDYDMYQDRANRQLAGADRYNDYERTAYQQFMDRYGRELDAADRLDQYGATEYGRYQDRLGQFNTDRNFQYGLNRDAVEDARYEEERDYNRAWDEEDRAYRRDYQARRDAVLDSRADREWAQKLREYADAQGWKRAEWEQYLREFRDRLSEKQRRWAYNMAGDAEA